MTINQAIIRIGSHALFNSNEGLKFQVRIIDAKTAYGKINFSIVPLNGFGNKWVSEERIKFED